MDRMSYARRKASPSGSSMGPLLALILWGCSSSGVTRDVDAPSADTATLPADAGGSQRTDSEASSADAASSAADRPGLPADAGASPTADGGALAADAGVSPGDGGAWSADSGLPPASMVTGLRFVPVMESVNPPPPVRVVVTDVSRAQDAYSATLALPAFLRRISCPIDFGVSYLLVFSFIDGSHLTVTFDPGGCRLVRIPGSSDRMSFSTDYDYWNRLAQDLGIPEATIFPYVPPAFQDSPDPQQEGVACTTNADCDADHRCGYLVADGCSATGVCMASACTGGNCAAPAPEICGCQGQTILPVWSQSSATSVVAVYASAPASGRLGPCTGGGDAGGTGIGPGRDGGGACDPGCQAGFFSLCVPVSWAKCVECYADADCAANPAAVGSICNTAKNYCECSSNADCKNNLWGHACDASNRGCACTSDSDCGPNTLGPSCNQGMCSCASDADCFGSNFGTKCDSAGLRCYCGSSADCPSSKSCTGSLGLGTWTYCQ